jgi:hypothetical protein
MFKVCESKCAQCLFTPERIVSKTRMQDILQDCAKRDTHFICHKSKDGESVCCRGFYDTKTSNLMRIAQRLGAVQFVSVEPEAQT